MANKMIESFAGVSLYEDFINNELGNNEANGGKWFQDAAGAAAFSLEAGGGIGGRQCLRKLSSASVNVRTRTIAGLVTEVIIGFRFKAGSLGASADGFFALYDQAGTVIFRLNHTSATVQIQYGSSSGVSTQFTTGSVLSTTRWDYFEVRYKMADAGAVTEVKMNGQILFTSTADNKQTASTSIARVGLGVNGQNSTGAPNDRWMDLYINDAAGAAPNNTYWGDTQVKVARPNGNGNSSQFVGSDGDSADNYQLIDESVRDPGDFVESVTDGDKDTYAFENISVTGTINAVQLVMQSGALNPSDPKDFNAVARLAAVESTVLVDLSTVMRENWATFETKPGGGAWTPTDFNSAEFGQQQVDA